MMEKRLMKDGVHYTVNIMLNLSRDGLISSSPTKLQIAGSNGLLALFIAIIPKTANKRFPAGHVVV
jgi:hypothetical protein